MESIRSESAIPFKSKKKSAVATTATPKKQPPPSPSPVAVITPEKSNPPSNRIRNQNFPLSVADVQRKALQLRQSNPNELDRPRRGAEDSIRSGTAVQKSKDSERSTALLPERRFTLHHLAQLKHIMPELIVVEKIRVLDEETKCMKEDLILKLEVDAVENDRSAKCSRSLKFDENHGDIEDQESKAEEDNVPAGCVLGTGIISLALFLRWSCPDVPSFMTEIEDPEETSSSVDFKSNSTGNVSYGHCIRRRRLSYLEKFGNQSFFRHSAPRSSSVSTSISPTIRSCGDGKEAIGVRVQDFKVAMPFVDSIGSDSSLVVQLF